MNEFKFYLVKDGKMIEFVQENWMTGNYTATYCKSLKQAHKFTSYDKAYAIASLVNAEIKEIK